MQVVNITRITECDVISNLLDFDFRIVEIVSRCDTNSHIRRCERIKREWDKVKATKQANRK